MARSVSRKAPAQAKALPRRPLALPALLAQLDQLAADAEARSDERDAVAVAVAVRSLVRLARQQAPEGARLTPTGAAGLCWRSGGSQGGEGIEAAPSSPAPSPAHLEMAEATLEALAHLSDAQEAARRLALALAHDIEPRDLPDLQDDARDLALCLDQLGGELSHCCYQATGLGGRGGRRSIVAQALDLASVVSGLRARLRPELAAEDAATRATAASIAARHFARSA